MDLAELFGRDPADLSKQDRREIVEALRDRRHTFNNTGKSQKVTTKAAAPAKVDLSGLPEVEL